MQREFAPVVYILASQKQGRLYTGVTSNLLRRIYEHREGLVEGHSKKYSIKRLMWFELHNDMDVAILREKRIKNWKRPWRIELIEKDNPDWQDLAIGLGFDPLPPQITRKD